MALGALDNIIKQLLGEAVGTAAQNADAAARVTDTLGDEFYTALREGRGQDYLDEVLETDGLDTVTREAIESGKLKSFIDFYEYNTGLINDVDAVFEKLATDPNAIDTNAFAEIFARHDIAEDNPLHDAILNRAENIRNGDNVPPGNDGVGGGADDAAKAAAEPPIEHTKIVEPPKRTWLHQAFNKYVNPYILWRTSGEAHQNPMHYLPNDLANKAYTRPFVDAFDEKIISSGMVDVMDDLKQNVQKITKRLETGKIDAEGANAEISEIISKFKETHGEAFENFTQNLNGIQRELRFERDIAELIQAARQDSIPLRSGATNADGSLKPNVQDKLEATIREYVNETGVTIDEAAYVDAVINKGGRGIFSMDSGQAHAMLLYADDLRNMMRNIEDLDGVFDNLVAQETNRTAVVEAINSEFRRFFTITDRAVMRTEDYKGLHTVKDVIPDFGMGTSWITRALRGYDSRTYKLEETDALVRQFEVGYYNTHRRTAKISQDKNPEQPNSERFGILIEKFDGSEEGTSKLIKSIVDAYHAGEEWEALHAIRNLRRRTGRGPDALPNILELLDPQPKRIPDGDKHYASFIDAIRREASNIEHSPEKYGQRHVLQMYSDFTHTFRYGRRFVGKNHVATPFKDENWTQPKSKALRTAFYNMLGATDVTFKEGSTEIESVKYGSPLAEGKTRGIFGKAVQPFRWVGRVGYRWAALPIHLGYQGTKFLVTNPVTRNVGVPVVGGGAVLAGIEGGLEEVLPENTVVTDEDGNLIVPKFVPFIGGDHVDFGSRMLGGAGYALNFATTPLRWGLQIENAAVKGLTGFDAFSHVNVPYHTDLRNNVIEWNTSWTGDRGDKPNADGNDSTAKTYVAGGGGNQNGNGNANGNGNGNQNGNGNGNTDDTTPVDPDRLAAAKAAVARSTFGGNDGIKGDMLPEFNALATQLARSNVDLNNSNAVSARLATDYANATKPLIASTQPTTTTTGGPGFFDQFNGASFDNIGNTLGNLAGSIGNSAFGWYGSPNNEVTRLAGNAMDFGGSLLSMGGKFLGNMDDKSRSLVFGGIAALMLTNFVKNRLGFLGKLPFAGLIVFGLLTGFGGRIINAFSGQGTGRHSPQPLQTHVTHTGSPVKLVVDNTNRMDGVKDITATDTDANGQYAIQIGKDGSGFVDFNVLQPGAQAANVDGAIANAKASGTFMPEAFLNGRGLADPTKWQYEAVDSTDHGKVIVMTPTAANSPNAPSAYVFDIAG